MNLQKVQIKASKKAKIVATETVQSVRTKSGAVAAYLKLVDYSPKSVAVRGDTFPLKDALKAQGGNIAELKLS